MKHLLTILLEIFGLGKRAQFRNTLLDVAKTQIGLGEEGSNNRGPIIEVYADSVGMQTPILWCAAFVSWVYKQTCRELGLKPQNVGRANAKRMADAVLAKGGTLVFSEKDGLLLTPRPGDLHVWHRGDNRFSGHIGIITEYNEKTKEFTAIDGNRGSFPSKVKYINYSVEQADLYQIVRFKELS